MIKQIKAILLVCIAAFIAGCSTKPTPTQAEISQPAVTTPPETEMVQEPTEEVLVPTITALPTPVVIYQEDFGDVNSGWERYNEYDGVLDYENDQYRMRVNATKNLFWVKAAIPDPQSDVAIQVTTYWQESQPDAPFGLICRLDSNNQYYYFYITGDGQYGIGKYLTSPGMEQVDLVDDGGNPSDVIRQGVNAENTLLVVCNGNHLSLTVNQVLLLEVQDDQLSGGELGLLAGVRETPGIDVFFDNYTVMRP